MKYSASITCISSIMRPGGTKAISDYSDNADERMCYRSTVFGAEGG
jgi:hypothetical protein